MRCALDLQVLPWYANTHTTTTATGLQTTRFREEARLIVRNATRASEHDAVLFAGSGVTGGIHRLVHALRIRERIARGEVVRVLVGPYEHHSNLLPWRDAGAQVQQVPEREDGTIDLEALRSLLQQSHPDHPHLLVGAFSAASNVTGLLTNVNMVTALLRAHGALAVWDYATAGPYVPMEMNPIDPSGEHDFRKDALLLSPHKFPGGPGSTGGYGPASSSSSLAFLCQMHGAAGGAS